MDSRADDFLMVCQNYRDDPIGFARDVLGITLTRQQSDALDALANGKRRTAIKSGHGVGKSCMSAVAALWFLCTRPFGRVVVTAPSSNQLYNTMMAEIKLWYNKSVLKNLSLFRFTKDRIRIDSDDHAETWGLSAVSVANPENISGQHAEEMFAIVDEGAGVDSEIFVRLEGVLTTESTYLLTCGNPSFTSGYFYDIFNNPNYAKEYDLFTFNCENSDNVKTDWIEYMKSKYGEDSAIYKVRVLGEFAPMDESIIISRDRVKRAIGRVLVDEGDTDTVHIGVDVASGNGGDKSCISVRRGYVEIERLTPNVKLKELMQTVAMTATKYTYSHSRVIINVDTTGLGIQLGQDLSDHFIASETVEVNEINFSNKANMSKMYNNSFTEMFFGLASIIDKVSLLDIDESTAEEDLGSRRFAFDNRNRYVAEKKKEFIKRYNRSPDEGDAILLAFYDMDGYGTLDEVYYDKGEW